MNGSFVTLPLDAVKFPPELGGGFNGTIGLASGVSFEDAVIHAIFEILEHDTISLFLNTGLPCYLIEIDDRQKELFDIRRAAESKGVKCTVRLLTSPFNVYPVLVTYENMPGFENYKVAGIGCSLDPVMATRRALTECEQSAALWFEKYKIVIWRKVKSTIQRLIWSIHLHLMKKQLSSAIFQLLKPKMN